MNVAQTYLEMTKEQGISARKAIQLVCDTVGLKFASNYCYEWPSDSNARTIPPAALKYMQQQAVEFAAKKLGINATEQQLKELAAMLGPKVKNS